MQVNNVTVLGAGTWGTTLANLLAEKGICVGLWDVSKQVVATLNETRTHPQLRGLEVSESILMTTDFGKALDGAQMIAIVVPSIAMRETAQRIKHLPGMGTRVYVICSKGIEEKSLKTMSQVLIDVLGTESRESIGVLSGPSHAEEVAQKLPTTVTAAAYNVDLAKCIQHTFFAEYFRIYTQEDILGVELGGALKNVIAIAAGICHGLGLGDNSKAALMTRGLAEITRLGIAMGAKRETFSGLAGVGDLFVTAMSEHSRNRTFGLKLAQGLTTQQALDEIGMVVEGIPTANSAHSLALEHNVPMPITEQVYKIIYEDKAPKDALKDLLMREPKPEIY